MTSEPLLEPMYSPDPFAQRQHLVSQWYQRNFADGRRRVTVLNARTGEVVAKGRAVRRNFVAAGYNTVVGAGGVADSSLEGEFAKIESRVAAQIKRSTFHESGLADRIAVAEHFALHLVRSPGFRLVNDRVIDGARREWVPRIARDPRLLARYQVEYGVTPTMDDLALLASEVLEESVAARRPHIDGMVRQYDRLANYLARFRIQVVTAHSLGSGFALADVPVVHANTRTGQYGLRDGLRINDADLIIGPIDRFTAVALSKGRPRPVTVTTKRLLQTINAVFVHAAFSEVACHPDDARELARVCEHADRFSPRRLVAS